MSSVYLSMLVVYLSSGAEHRWGAGLAAEYSRRPKMDALEAAFLDITGLAGAGGIILADAVAKLNERFSTTISPTLFRPLWRRVRALGSVAVAWDGERAGEEVPETIEETDAGKVRLTGTPAICMEAMGISHGTTVRAPHQRTCPRPDQLDLRRVSGCAHIPPRKIPSVARCNWMRVCCEQTRGLAQVQPSPLKLLTEIARAGTDGCPHPLPLLRLPLAPSAGTSSQPLEARFVPWFHPRLTPSLRVKPSEGETHGTNPAQK